MGSFQGFPTGTIKFLQGLSLNNNKSWFDAHRDEYQALWLEPATEFVVSAREGIHRFRPQIMAEPRLNGSIFRINRDIRFTKDKTPYKDHLDLWFWEGERRSAISGLFFRLTPESVLVGVGTHGFDRSHLALYRNIVGDPEGFESLSRAVEAVEACGHQVLGDELKRNPVAYRDLTGERARLIRFTSLSAIAEHPAGKWVHTPSVLEWAMKRWEQMLPIHLWLVEKLGAVTS